MPGTVTIGCKVPNGIVMKAYKMEPRTELLQGGGTREIRVAVPFGQAFAIRGPRRLDRPGSQVDIAHAYALTHNVDADIWDAWKEAHRDTELVRNDLVIAHVKPNEVSAAARANETRRTGLEPMQPMSPDDKGGDPRMARRRQELRGGAISAMETAVKG